MVVLCIQPLGTLIVTFSPFDFGVSSFKLSTRKYQDKGKPHSKGLLGNLDNDMSYMGLCIGLYGGDYYRGGMVVVVQIIAQITH